MRTSRPLLLPCSLPSQCVAEQRRLRPDGFLVPTSRFAQHRCRPGAHAAARGAAWGPCACCHAAALRCCHPAAIPTCAAHTSSPACVTAGAGRRSWIEWRRPGAPPSAPTAPSAAAAARGWRAAAIWDARSPWQLCRVRVHLGGGREVPRARRRADVRCAALSGAGCPPLASTEPPHTFLPRLALGPSRPRRPAGGLLLHAGRGAGHRGGGARAAAHPGERRPPVHRDDAADRARRVPCGDCLLLGQAEMPLAVPNCNELHQGCAARAACRRRHAPTHPPHAPSLQTRAGPLPSARPAWR